jgi:hypothetical protein
MVSGKKWREGKTQGLLAGAKTLWKTGRLDKASQAAQEKDAAVARPATVQGFLANIKLAWGKFTKWAKETFTKVDKALDDQIRETSMGSTEENVPPKPKTPRQSAALENCKKHARPKQVKPKKKSFMQQLKESRKKTKEKDPLDMII